MHNHDRMPWDKSLIIRYAFLDLIRGVPQRSIKWLEDNYNDLGDDLRALLRTLKQYLAGEDLDVGESDTLRVFWLEFLRSRGDDREVVSSGTLKLRDPASPQSSKWASIAVLLGQQPDPTVKAPHLALTYRAKWQWEQATERGEMWVPQKDQVIAELWEAYLIWRQTGVMPLVVDNPEKTCQAMAFGLTTPTEALALYPGIADHESNRPVAMQAALDNLEWIVSDDHRVVMAMAMLGVPYENFSNPGCVTKSDRHFWQRMEITA